MLHSQPTNKLPVEANDIHFTGVNRLVVLVPDLEADEAKLSHQIYSLAQSNKVNVLLVSLVNDPGNEYRALRRMTSIASIIRDAWVSVETQVIFGSGWIKAIKPILQPDDLVICSEGQTTPYPILQSKPLAPTVSMVLHQQVFTIPNYFEEQPSLWPTWIKRLPYWAGVAAILVGFFFMEVDINHSVRDWAGQLILMLLVLVEAGVILGWTLVAG